jgi:C-terminal processing protease CtpA/Prc
MERRKHIVFFLLTSLILGCGDMIVSAPDANRNMEDFEAVWNRVNDVYPFLEFKAIDWDSIYTVYLQRVEEARGDEFYLVLNDLLAELRDGHVYYHTDGGGEVYPFYPQRHFKDRHAYSPFVVRKYFDKELRVTDSESAEYEILPGNIGYVFLSDFHEDYLINEFPAVMDHLRNTEGLIIDIRQKRGGELQNIEAVVSWFVSSPIDWPRLYYLGEPVTTGQVQPRGSFTYTSPVVVLINGSTYSAGEVCTEVLRQLPNVTAVGDTTGGGGGAGASYPPALVSDYDLPSGKLISTPTGYFERYDGQMIEWLGVPPDIQVTQTESDIKAGRDRQLEYAIDMLK